MTSVRIIIRLDMVPVDDGEERSKEVQGKGIV